MQYYIILTKTVQITLAKTMLTDNYIWQPHVMNC